MKRTKKNKNSQNSIFPFKNIEQLAIYYCQEAGVEHFRDLKNTIYWDYYLEDSKIFYKKTISETKILPSIEENGIILCKSCGEQLGATIDRFVLLNLNYSFQHHNAPLKILCKCGHQNIFEEIEKLKKEE